MPMPPPGSLVALDTMVLIYALEGNERYGPRAREVLRRVEVGEWRAVIASLVVTEVLTAPLKVGRTGIADMHFRFLERLPNLDIAPMTVEVARVAAELRAEHGLGTPDAIHLATARVAGATAFFTNDARLARIDAPHVVLADDWPG